MGMGGGIGVAAKGGFICQVAGAGIIGISFLGVIAVAVRASRCLGSGQPVEGVIGKRQRLGIAHLTIHRITFFRKYQSSVYLHKKRQKPLKLTK